MKPHEADEPAPPPAAAAGLRLGRLAAYAMALDGSMIVRMIASQSDPQFERDALAAFAFIAAPPGPRVVHSRYDPGSFGNAVVELESDALRVRVTRDRGQLLVDLAPRAGGEWFDEAIILQLVGAGETARELAAAEWRALAPSASALRRHLSEIVDRFRPDQWAQTRAELKALQARRARELFGWPGVADRHRDPAV